MRTFEADHTEPNGTAQPRSGSKSCQGLRITNFEAYLTTRRRFVDKALRSSVVVQGIANLHDGVRYALGLDTDTTAHRGKRLRAVLCLLVAESCGGTLAQAMPFGLACELMHNFMLIHDDIQDGDCTRRGRDSVWVRYGRAHAINIGDYLLVLAYRTALRSSGVGMPERDVLHLLHLFTEALERSGEGQTLDLNARAQRDLTVEDYLETVARKTGCCLTCALVGGALVSGAPSTVLDALQEFGRAAMLTFQIADDLLDFTSGKGRQEIGTDVQEGKRSYLVMHTASQCTTAEAALMYDILDKPRDRTTAADVQTLLDLFHTYQAEEAARTQASALLARAVSTLKQLPSPLRENLELAAHYLIHRST